MSTLFNAMQCLRKIHFFTPNYKMNLTFFAKNASFCYEDDFRIILRNISVNRQSHLDKRHKNTQTHTHVPVIAKLMLNISCSLLHTITLTHLNDNLPMYEMLAEWQHHGTGLD